jgi:hypothetical protein
VAGVPEIIGYHLDRHRFGAVDFSPVTTPPETFARSWQYVVYRESTDRQLSWRATAPPPVLQTADGYLLYQVVTVPASRREPGVEGPR